MTVGLKTAAALALIACLGCSFDSDKPAPFVESPNALGPCGSTDTVFPKLLAFLHDGGFMPLAEVLEARLVPNADHPTPDPSVRTLLDALVQLLHAIGLGQAATTASLLAQEKALVNAKPLLVTALEFTAGKIQGEPDHYAATEAAAVMIRRCDPDFLLTAIAALLRLKSPSHGQRLWLHVVGEEALPLLDDPALKPFLSSFMKDAAMGRPAIIALLAQILGLISQDGFTISRVETLLESAVYPAVDDTLRIKIDGLVGLLGEATDATTGILSGLQGALRCGEMHPEERDQLLGFVYDLITSQAVGLDALLNTAKMLTTDEDAARVQGQLADVIDALRADQGSRSSILELGAMLLSRPNVSKVMPVLIELIDKDVVTELLGAVEKLLSGCNRS